MWCAWTVLGHGSRGRGLRKVTVRAELRCREAGSVAVRRAVGEREGEAGWHFQGTTSAHQEPAGRPGWKGTARRAAVTRPAPHDLSADRARGCGSAALGRVQPGGRSPGEIRHTVEEQVEGRVTQPGKGVWPGHPCGGHQEETEVQDQRGPETEGSDCRSRGQRR